MDLHWYFGNLELYHKSKTIDIVSKVLNYSQNWLSESELHHSGGNLWSGFREINTGNCFKTTQEAWFPLWTSLKIQIWQIQHHMMPGRSFKGGGRPGPFSDMQPQPLYSMSVLPQLVMLTGNDSTGFLFHLLGFFIFFLNQCPSVPWWQLSVLRLNH